MRLPKISPCAYSDFACGGDELQLRPETLQQLAAPQAGIGSAYVTNQMGTSLTGDPGEIALRQALYSAISR